MRIKAGTTSGSCEEDEMQYGIEAPRAVTRTWFSVK